MAKALIEIVGEAESLVYSIKKSIASVSTFKTELRSLNVDVAKSAEAQVKASTLRVSRIREEMTAIRELAATYKRGSSEQVAAMQLVARKQAELNRLQGVGYGAGGRGGLRRDERQASGILRGGLRGGGVGGAGLAALAGGAFFSSYLGAAGVRTVISAATQARVIERQLAAQYRASGQSLSAYRKEVDATLARESALAGFNKDELTQSYTTIYRAVGDTGKALKDEAIAVDLARGKHMDLQAAALLEAKVLNGNVGILRRYGIETYKGETATEALAAISAKYAGQAQAGTTAQQRFSAELHNSEVIIGTALLPIVSHLLGEGARWLDQMNRSGRLQRDVNAAVREGVGFFRALRTGVNFLRGALHAVDGVTGGFKQTLELLLALKVASKLEGWASDFGLMRTKTMAEADAVSTLRGRLANLASLGTIVVTVDVLEQFIPSHVLKHGQKVLDQGGGGFLGKLPIVGPVAQAGAALGRDTRNAITGEHQGTPTGVPSKFSGTSNQLEAYLAGKSGDAFPFPFSDPSFTADFAAYTAGRKAGGTRIGGKRGHAGHSGTRGGNAIHEFSLTRGLQNELAAATTPGEDRKAAQDALNYTEKLLASGRLVGQAYTDALKERKKLYAEIARDAKKLAGSGGSVLSARTQEDLAAAQGAAASKGLPALKRLLTVQEQALSTLRAQHLVGEKRVKQVKTEAQLQEKIASTEREIARIEKNTAAATAARKADQILGLGTPRTPGVQRLSADERGILNTTLAHSVFGSKASKAQIAQITKRTADLSLSELVAVVKKDLGDKLPAATLESLQKINTVLKMKLLPPDVLANIRSRLAQIKSTLLNGLGDINRSQQGFHGVSSHEFVNGIPGLTRAQKIALEEKYSQVQAHGGTPTGPAVLGMATNQGAVINLYGAQFHGVEDLDKLIAQIEKRSRHKVQRGGSRR